MRATVRPVRAIDAPGTIALALGVIAWGAMPVFLRALTGYVDAWVANGLRYPFAAVLYWPVLVWAAKSGRLPRETWRRAMVPAGFSLFGQIFFAQAPYYIDASLMGFLVKLAPLWTLAGAMTLFPEERALLGSSRFHGGLLLALGGFAGLAVSQGALEAEATAAGVIIMIFCSAGYGLYGVSVRYFLRSVHPLVAFGVVCQYVALGTLALLPLGRTQAIGELAIRGWTLVVVSSIIGIGISHALYFLAIQRLGATLATSGHLLGPFVTLLLGAWFLGEAMSPAGWLAGGVLVAGGLLLVLAQERIHRAFPERVDLEAPAEGDPPES